MFRHGAFFLGEAAIYDELRIFQNDLTDNNRWLQEHGYISRSAQVMLDLDVETGIKEGHLRSRSPAPTDLMAHCNSAAPPLFSPFNVPGRHKLRIALVSQGYPPSDTSGIPRWTQLLATGLVRNGHEIHVITRTNGEEVVDYQDGMWIHRVLPESKSWLSPFAEAVNLPPNITNWSLTVCSEILRIGTENLDVVVAPIWDLEGLATSLIVDIPVVTWLQTTYKLAYPHKPDWHRPMYYWNHVRKVVDGERLVFERAPYFLGNSHAIVRDISEAYDVDIAARTIVVHQGGRGT